MKLPGCEADFLLTSSIEVKNIGSAYPHFPIYLDGVVLNQAQGHFYIFSFIMENVEMGRTCQNSSPTGLDLIRVKNY
jgi:hypothetical protein